MNSILFKPQSTAFEGYAHGNQDVAVRWAIGRVPPDLTIRVFSGLGQTLMPGLVPTKVDILGQADTIFLRWSETQKQTISGYNSLWIELIWDGVVQLAGPLRMNLSAGTSQPTSLVTVRTRTSGEVYVYADQLINLALTIQGDVTTKLGQVTTLKDQVEQLKVDTNQIKSQTNQIKSATQQIHDDTNQLKLDTAQIKSATQQIHDDTNQIKLDTAQIKSATQQIHDDTNQLKVDTAQIKADTQQIHDDTNQLKVDTAQIKSATQQIHDDTNQLKVDTGQIKLDTTQLKADTQQLYEQTQQEKEIAVQNRFLFKGLYQNNTAYGAGDGVIYSNSFIRRKTAGNSGSMFVSADWDFLAIGINLRGTWQPNTYYAINDLVIFRRSAYLAPANFTTGTTFVRANWVRIAAGWNPAGAWTANTTYYEDDILTNQGSTYRVITDYVSGASFSATNLELIASKGDPGTLTVSALTAVTNQLATDLFAVQRADGSLAKVSPVTGYPTIQPSLLLDFAGTGIVSPRLTFVRTGSALRKNRTGQYESCGVNVPRMNFDQVWGYLPEISNINLVRNLVAQGAVVGALGSGGSLPTNWAQTQSYGGAITTIIGTGTENGLPYVDINVAGTASSTDALQLNFETGYCAMTAGQRLTSSVFIKLISGNPQLGTCYFQYTFFDSSTNALSGGGNSANNTLTTTSASMVGTSPVAPANTAKCLVLLTLPSPVSGTTYDFTFRLSAPQVEIGVIATTPILTTGATATRGWDQLSMNTSSSWFNQDEFSVFTEVYISKYPSVNVNQTIFSLNGTYWFYLYQNTASTVYSGGTLGGNSNTIPLSMNQIQRFVFTFKKGEKLKIFGASGSTMSQYVTPTNGTVTSLNIGHFVNGDQQLNNNILRLAIYPKQLTDSEAQTLVL